MPANASERGELLGAFEGLRVADVRDALDALGYHRFGSMSPAIRPVFRTRACGIARTVRYLPYAGPMPTLPPEEYDQWASWYYREVCPYPWIPDIHDGDFCVIDQSGVDAGLMGSNNTLAARKAGARGFVTNGGVRDTDELILQQIPFWSAFVSQSMVQTKLQFDAMDIPVAVGGVAVYPGDLVVADGDGVIVVPGHVAPEVARIARKVLTTDKAQRRALYRELGMHPDPSVQDTD